MVFLKKLGSILLDILIVLLVLVILFNVFFIVNKDDERLPSLFGYKFLVDLTNSMLPEIESGDMIIIKEEDVYKVDDIVAYRNHKDILITHRIVKIDNGRYYFKGDNNNMRDIGYASKNDIEGKYIKKIKKLGSICMFLQSIYGIIFMLVVMACYVVFLVIKERFFS